jgi:intein-encoded DNA endonuclease-like protein
MNGESGHTIARKFSVDNSTIYDCLKRQKIEVRSSKEAGILASSKGRIAKHSIPISSFELSPEKSYILGVMCGDGYLSCTKNQSYQIALQAVDRDFVFEFSKCLKKVYGIRPAIAKIAARRINWNEKLQSRVCCKEIFIDILKYGNLKTKSWRVPKIIFESSDEIKSKFLKGFFDSEGSVEIIDKRLTAVSINENGLNEIAILLKSVGIRSRIRKNSTIVGNRSLCFSLRITGRQNILAYSEKIGFSIKRKQIKLDKLIKGYVLLMKTHEEAKEFFPTMKELRSKGMSYEKIGNELGLGTVTVWNYLNGKHKSGN